MRDTRRAKIPGRESRLQTNEEKIVVWGKDGEQIYWGTSTDTSRKLDVWCHRTRKSALYESGETFKMPETQDDATSRLFEFVLKWGKCSRCLDTRGCVKELDVWWGNCFANFAVFQFHFLSNILFCSLKSESAIHVPNFIIIKINIYKNEI